MVPSREDLVQTERPFGQESELRGQEEPGDSWTQRASRPPQDRLANAEKESTDVNPQRQAVARS